MKQTASIHNWRVHRLAPFHFVLEGEVRDHPNQASFHSKVQMTSKVEEFRPEDNIAITRNTTYTLGEQWKPETSEELTGLIETSRLILGDIETAINKAFGNMRATGLDPDGPDASDGCDHDGFVGGCERAGHKPSDHNAPDDHVEAPNAPH